MASASVTPELLRLSSIAVAPLDYFTDSSNTINTKSDLILIVGKERFYCHRLLLSLVSPVFTRMFEGQFKEHQEREIVLEGKTSESILELLKYIYPQFHGEITDANVEDFLQLADEYMIEHLKQPCKNLLVRQLELFKTVLLPTQQRLEQPSVKPKNFHASDTALHTPRPNEEHSAASQPASNRLTPSRRPTSSSRQSPGTKMPSSYLKPNDKSSGSASSHPRYVLFLEVTRMPTFFDAENVRLSFVTNDVELWLRRLRILYQIDKGRNYSEVIDLILSILQFIPAQILLPLTHVSASTYATDEIMLNDIARARMFVLEEWAADGNPYRSVHLTVGYRMMSPSALLINQQLPMTPTIKSFDLDDRIADVTMIVSSDSEESNSPHYLETAD